MKNIFFKILIISLLMVACSIKEENTPFVHIENGLFIRDGQPYKYVGANFWYGSILASEGDGGDRKRLLKELDFLKSIGVDNLRILVGSDGKNGVPSKVEPTLQIAPGVYNDTILDGLDFLLAEMKKRNMLAVLYLNNSWEWSGGYGQYLEWAGEGKAPVPAIDGWPAYMNFVQKYPKSKQAQSLFARYVKDMVTRVNRYTNVKYTEDPTIMSWQVGNEPRAFSEENKENFAHWMSEVTKLIKALDSNHLVSTGSEGKHGCEGDIALFEQIHSDPNVDYMNIHIWPYNWEWTTADSLRENLQIAKINTTAYIDEHLLIAERYNKPVVLEEFGFPRDGFQFDKKTKTTVRDEYYRNVFELLMDTVGIARFLSGCNFWAWGGFAEPQHVFWQKGDDYTGDPAQEQQGLNSVFVTDTTTVELIFQINYKLNNRK